jgi:hypothetical protein
MSLKIGTLVESHLSMICPLTTHLDPMIAGPEGGPSSDMQRFED